MTMDPQSRGGRMFRTRRRRANAPGGRIHRHVVKVTPEEEARLLLIAERHHVTVPRLLIESALAQEGRGTVAERHELVGLLFGLHRLLATISNNVNQIARATNSTGELQPETAAALHAVRRVAERIDEAVDGLIQ